ncbi:hypothetical protein CC78DRAFT_587042 [Lojkania enalia]|uniref:Uncharacterized protein n=1 Tax=Lojkania enalia TaxID=147567 RepID=A0A9P4MV36_9PLEO|nr:hypothetical protein CC78DRAFT_587042 [Didymosphaeria enalia]
MSYYDNTYRYLPVCSIGKEIRLIRLLPVGSSSPSDAVERIECKLYYANLQTDTHYIALSYGLESPTPSHRILLNLWRLSDGQALYGISQDRSEEKIRQVQMKKDIYCQANHVIAYLGLYATNRCLMIRIDEM